MFFRRVFSNKHDTSSDAFDESSSNNSIVIPVKNLHRQLPMDHDDVNRPTPRGLYVLQLTPLWEHIIRTNSLPAQLNITDMFNEFHERLTENEWQVRQHALRVLVDVLIVMGQQADYHIGKILHPLVDNLGHIAPAVRKGALDALRVYVAQTAMPETVMLDILNYGMGKPSKDPMSGRMTVAVMLAIPALILPILITPKRAFVVKSVVDALASKMVQITYQEIALKILIKIKEMVGPHEFSEHMPVNVRKDFDLLCKVYGLPKSPSFRDSGIDLHIPSDAKKPWASKFVPKKDSNGNAPSSHAPVNYMPNNHNSKLPADDSNFMGNFYEDQNSTGTGKSSLKSSKPLPPKKPTISRQNTGILRTSSDKNLNINTMPGSSGSESSEAINYANSLNINKFKKTDSRNNPEKSCSSSNSNGCDKSSDEMPDGKVIMETEIKISPETAVTMRILEQNPTVMIDDSDDDNSTKRIITDFSAPYPVIPPNRSKSVMKMNATDSELEDDDLNYNSDGEYSKRTPRRVRFGGEIVKMRTPDSDTIEQSDVDANVIPKPSANLTLPPKQNSNLSNISINSDNSDNSSENSSENSNDNEYIKPADIASIQKSSVRNSVEAERNTAVPTYVNYAFNERFPINKLGQRAKTSDSIAIPKSAKVIHSPIKTRESYENSTEITSSGKVVHSPEQNNNSAYVSRSYENLRDIEPKRNTNDEFFSPSKSSNSNSPKKFDYSQQLQIGIPDNTTVLPAHATPPEIIIKKSNMDLPRPATSPMPASPRIVTIPASSSSNSSRNNSPRKYANNCSRSSSMTSLKPRSKSMSPERNRRLTPRLSSPRVADREITMLHNLQRSPISSPLRSRRNSFEDSCRNQFEEATQTSENYIKSDEMTQTPNNRTHIDEMTQTSLFGDTVYPMPSKPRHCMIKDFDSSPDSGNNTPRENPNVKKFQSWEELGIVEYSTLKDLKSGDWQLRSRAFCVIEHALKNTENLALVQPYLDSLLRTLLMSEKHPDVIEDQRRILTNLITRLPLENLENHVTQIITGLCRQGGAGSNMVAKSLMQRLPTAAIVLKLLSDEFLQARSSRFRENSLQMVIFALMTFPSTYFDIGTCVHRTTKAALDKKKRVRQAALDVLAVLGQISSPKFVIEKVAEKIEHRKDHIQLIAAVKARLARKQLPLVSTTGDVQYALKIPTAQNTGTVVMFGSDVEWICSGSGSVSPLSNKPTTSFADDRTNNLELSAKMPNFSTSSSSNSTGPKSNSPWSRIPVRGSSGSEDEHGFVVGTAIQQVTKPIPSTGRFYGKMQSRSFPELSENFNKPQPVRQLSDQDSPTGLKRTQSKLPISSVKFPAMDHANDKQSQNCNKQPYSFAPSYKSKTHTKVITSSAEYLNDSIGSPVVQSNQIESRPSTYPPTDLKPKDSGSPSKNIKRKNSGKGNRYDLLIQPLTTSISLVDDYKDKEESTQKTPTSKPDSCKSKTSSNKDENDNKKFIESYVEEQTRRNSAKTNSHILCDTDDDIQKEVPSLNSTPKHKEKNDHQTEIENVKNELAQIQNVIENVKKEMVEMQKQQLRQDEPDSRPQSVNSNKTFIFERTDSQEADKKRPKTSVSRTKGCKKSDDAAQMSKNQAISLENIPNELQSPPHEASLKSESTTDDKIPVIMPDQDTSNDDRSTNSNLGKQTDKDFDGEAENLNQNETEVDEASNYNYSGTNEETLARTDSTGSFPKDMGDEKLDEQERKSDSRSEESMENEGDFYSPSLAMPNKTKRSYLKKSSKIMPAKNILPNHPAIPVNLQSKVYLGNEMFPVSLRRFERPKDAVYACLSQLDSTSWETVMGGLQTFVRLIRHHPEYVDNNVHLLSIALSKQVRNLRSQVSRAAALCCGEFFVTHNRVLDTDAEELASALLHRSADTNKFLRNDATNALESMCDYMHPLKVVYILTFRGATHQNAIVRCTTAKLLNRLVHRIGCEKVFALPKDVRDKLILTAAHFLMEGSLETRNYTKDLFKQLSVHPYYQKVLLDVIPNNIYRNIEKSLKSIR